MKKIVRLTESDLIRLVKRVISEQSSGYDSDRFRSNDVIVGGVGATGNYANIDDVKVYKWLDGCGNQLFGSGNNPNTIEIAKLFITGISGLDVFGTGEVKLKKAIDDYIKLDLVNQNQVLKDYCKLVSKSYKSSGFITDLKGDSNLYKNVLTDSKNKINQFCKKPGSSYLDWVTFSDKENQKNGNKKPSEEVMKLCGTFTTLPEGSVLF